ncbi:MAG: DUF4249 domain-containing protein [Cyclobacteriaceae bacterium]|nr:DUF4249 domain-containing protein [Cyclobacteriaceae bacterium]
MANKSIILFALLTLLISCIDPFDVRTGGKKGRLVVDGMITNFSQASVIKLSRSLAFDNTGIISSYFDPERDATVIVKDNLGNEIQFNETQPGVYLPDPAFTGTVGNEYILQIQTSDGQQYLSSAEKMFPIVPIEEVLYEYHVYEELVQNVYGQYFPVQRFGFRISVQSNDTETERNYYRWKVRGIFEFFSFIGETIFQCWVPVPRLETGVRIRDDLFVNGNSFTEPVAIIPYDRTTYYQVTVQQQSLTPDAYRFWNDIRNQQTNTGSIFDPIPSQINGNIYNVNDPGDAPFGFFSASALTEKTILINRFQASGFVSPSPNIMPQEGNCINQILNATNIKPPGFP